jgi:hypothetical protein
LYRNAYISDECRISLPFIFECYEGIGEHCASVIPEQSSANDQPNNDPVLPGSVQDYSGQTVNSPNIVLSAPNDSILPMNEQNELGTPWDSSIPVIQANDDSILSVSVVDDSIPGGQPISNQTPQRSVQESNSQLSNDPIPSVSVPADSLPDGQPNNGDFPARKQSAAKFDTLIKIPKMNRLAPRRQRKVAHAVVATSSPFKAALQISFDNKEQKRQAKERRQCAQKMMRTDSTRRNRPKRSTQQSTTKRKRRSTSATNQIAETSDTEDEPLSKLCAKSTASAATRCSYCNKAEGPNGRNDWISCCGCGKWLHEYCAEEYGVFDDTQYLCMTCV